MRIDQVGNVGIGTTNPSSRLEIKATSATHKLVSINRPSSDTAALYIGNDSASPSNGIISSNHSDLIFGKDQSGTLSEWMRIKRDGNVGIGNTNPLAKLQITNGDSGASSPWSNADELVLESSGNAGLAFQTPNTGAATIAFQDPESVQAGFIQYLHADNALRFATNGNNERMRIESTGVVKFPNTATSTGDVGTIAHYTNNYMYIRGGTSGLAIGDDGFDTSIYLNNSDSIQFQTGGTERMRINSQGQMWLGGSYTGSNIANGSTGYMNNLNAGSFSILHRNSSDVYVHFNSYYTSSNTYVSKYNGRGFMLGYNAAADTGFFFSKAPSTAAGQTQTFSQVMTVGHGTSNNVGIGTTSPQVKLHVAGRIRSTYDGNTAWYSGNYVRLFNSQEFNFLNSSGASIASINLSGNSYFNGGNVGIGTTNPGVKLDIDNGAVTDVRIRGNQTSDARIGAYNFYNTAASDVVAAISADRDGANDAAALAFDTQIAGGGMTERMRITSTGNVGIGTTSPSERLSVDGNAEILKGDDARVYIKDVGDSSTILLRSDGVNTSIGTDSNHDLQIQTNGSTKMYIESGGNVGIGTTSPNAPLQFSNAITTRKVVLYEMANNNNQFYGFGVEAAKLVYSTANTGDDHVFYAGASSTSRNELIRIDGSNGDIKLSPSSRIILDDTPTASTASGSGTIVNWSVSDATTAGTLYTVKTNGLWTPVDADNEATSIGMLAIALGSNATAGMLLQGFFYKASHGFTIGLPLYISNTAGAFSTTRPTGANDYVRIIGYATSANYIYFDPDKTWVQVA